MKISSVLPRLLALGLGALALGAVASPAEARTVSALTGGANGGDQACLEIWYGTMTNRCSHTVSFDWPLVVDTAGTHYVTVTAYGASSSQNVGCRAEGLNKESTTVWYSNGGAYIYLPRFGAAADIVTSGAYTPSGGQILVNCQMNVGSRIQVANWTP